MKSHYTRVALGFGVLLCSQGRLHAQNILEADAAAFRLDSATDQVEVYYGVLQRGLKFTQTGSSWEAPFTARVELWQNGTVVEKREISQQIRYQGTQATIDSIGANKLLGVTAFAARYKPNTFAAFIWQRGSASAADTIRSEPLDLPQPVSDKIEVGGIELGSSLEKSSGASNPFEKAGYILTPNPSSVYGENYTKLYYYTEIYVPRAMGGTGESMTITTRIVDPTGKQVLSRSEKQALAATTIPIIIALDIDGLPQNSYRLQVQVKDEDAVIAQREKTFFFVSGMQISEEPSTSATQSPEEMYAGSPIATLADASVDELLEQTYYLTTESERRAARQLKTADAKRKFLYDFWIHKDAPNAAPLSSYAEFQRRLKYVADKFSYQRTPGWKTSRGRVYLVYGPPRYVGGEEFNPETKPYITWGYDPLPNVRVNTGNQPEFVFLDRQGGGNYVLVHSNVIGEVSEPDWYSREAHRLLR